MNFDRIVEPAIQAGSEHALDEFGVTLDPEDITGTSRHAVVCAARAVAVQKMHESGVMTLADIGRVLGGRHHSTVHYILYGKGGSDSYAEVE